MTKTLLLVLLFATVSYCRSYQRAESSQLESTSQARRTTYLQLNRQIYARHEDPGFGYENASQDELIRVSQQLHRMVGNEISLSLATAKPAPRRYQRGHLTPSG